MPSTPIGELRRKLGVLRQQGMASASKLERQGLSSSTSMLLTPAPRPTLATSISFTAVKPRPGPSSFRLMLPRTPAAEPASGSEVPSLESSPNASGSQGPSGGDEDGADAGNDSGEVEDEEDPPRSRSTSPSVPPSLSFAGLKEMLRPLAPPKTPNFTGMRELFAPSNRDQMTPAFSGVKEGMKVSAVAPTPSFVGVKEMMRTKIAPPTPAFDGIDQMLAEPELEAFEGEQSMEEGFEPAEAQSIRSRASTRGRKPAPSRSTRANRSASADLEASSKPSRARKSSTQPSTQAPDEEDLLGVKTVEGADVPPSPAKSTRSTKSRSSARSGKSETSKSARSARGGARRKIETESGKTVEIIKSSPPRPAISMPEESSPTKSKPSRSGRATKKDPLMDVDEQVVEEAPSKSSRRGKGKSAATTPDSESFRSTTSKTAVGRKKVAMAVEDKENDDQEAVQAKVEKIKLRKARQSTVASRTRSRT